MASGPSLLSRFRVTGVSVIVGVGLAGAVFYGLLNNHYLAAMLSRTLGPYSDTLAEHVFTHPDPGTVRQMAERHRVAIMVEAPGRQPFAFDARGEPLPALATEHGLQVVRAVRTAPDGTRVTLWWTLWSVREGHLPLLGGLLVMITAVVGSAFWFLQRQLKPLSWLRGGVEAVSRGDFRARVPVIRSDEIGQVAGAFNEMTARVGRMIQERERLLADVSHELRSPIARMKVALELIPEGDKRESLARDLREMESLISALLEREALRSPSGRLRGRELDLAALAGEVAAEFSGRPPGVEVSSRGEATMHADDALMKLLVRNLLDNAIKFSRPDSRAVEVSVEPAGESVILRVRDNGTGIPPESVDKVFDPFVKLDRARGHHAGYGLGLDLCRRIAQLHGGTIVLSPSEPRGTEAVVTLPRRP